MSFRKNCCISYIKITNIFIVPFIFIYYISTLNLRYNILPYLNITKYHQFKVVFNCLLRIRKKTWKLLTLNRQALSAKYFLYSVKLLVQIHDPKVLITIFFSINPFLIFVKSIVYSIIHFKISLQFAKSSYLHYISNFFSRCFFTLRNITEKIEKWPLLSTYLTVLIF